jgi:hypothetical protein
MRFLEKLYKISQGTDPTGEYRADERDVFSLSRMFGCSEFEIFRISALNWDIEMSRVAEDFKDYLLFCEVPFYVKAWACNKNAWGTA